jgi:hypothetical protein
MLATEWSVNVHGERGADIIFRDSWLAGEVAKRLGERHIDCTVKDDSVVTRASWKKVFTALIAMES